jgi:pyruvate/2-oxoglutarate/acetoin dehydrogenase E1 component
MKYREAIHHSMKSLMKNEDVVIIGQGVTDFKEMWGTLSGFRDEFSERLIETPIAEDSISGVCVGLALNKIYPINTHIRADFGLLTFNQLINLIAKYRYMFGGLFELPMLFRFVIGRSWGQGAQHSQSLQSLLGHIPGLTVIMPSNSKSLIESYNYAYHTYKNPVISFEHRLLYELDFNPEYDSDCPFDSHIIKKGKDLTIIATSIMVLEAFRASNYLQKFGIDVEIIDLNNISYPSTELILKSIKKTQRLIIADSSWPNYGVISEISRIILQSQNVKLLKPLIGLGMQFSTCPTAKALEDLFYPGIYEIIEAVSKICEVEIPLPKKQSMTDYYKHFKGPF